ncbi:zinc finger protein [Fusarium sporotrichioides]|uniref:Zinc finger protein n=1 Tax=Fusarium sporotrichioides TaxID=5514 RepID=A0A395RJD6_FUSSP|nr:zinc finger protein [Fusarium sporotrichioides]
MASSIPQTSPSADGTRKRIESDPLFDKAVAKFKNRLTKEQTQKFASCTLDDVKTQIREIQSRHGSKRRLRDMDRLSKFVEGMVQLGQVVEVFLNLHNTVALIWGPLKFLLLTASTWIDTLDSLLDVYGQIGEVLPDLTRYSQIYKEYPSIHMHLEDYYCDILQFHSNALDVFARPGWKVLFHSAWKTFKTQFGPILKSLERHRVMLSEEKLTAVMEETKNQGQSIQASLDQMNRECQERDQKNAERDAIAHRSQIDQQYRTVQSKVDAPDYHEDYEIASQKRFQSTSGHWFLGHPLVSEWLGDSSKANEKIYLSGIPGAVSQDEILLDHVYQSCRSAEPQQFRSLDEISRQVSTALQSQSRCFVIIDGLDECSEASRVLEWFESVMSKRDNTSKEADFNIRLFVSGQRDGILECQMSRYKRIDLETSSGHDQEISAFAATMAGKIRDRFSLDSEVEQEITSRVTSKASGMFLYAQLVLNNLFSQTSRYDLKQELKADTFPEGLEQAYDRVIVRVLRNLNKAERAVAKQILGMVMCACRPLHWREIQSKFCVDPSKGEADIDRELVMSCKQICSSLVDISYLESSVSSPGEEIVDLVHTTAKVYLVQTKEIDVRAENAKMALFCAEYMISRPLACGILTLEVQEYAMKGYYGFLDYAAAFWWKHVQQVLAASELDNELTLRILRAAHSYVIDTGELEEVEALDDSSGAIRSLKSKLERIPQGLRDWNSITIYEMRVLSIRTAIEGLVNLPYERKPSTAALCGPLRYKCRKPWCQYFSRGFEDAQQQQIHVNQHELPFTCNHQGCFATEVGFEKECDLKNHTRRWHPKNDISLFPKPKHQATNHAEILKAVQRGDLDTVKTFIEQGGISLDGQKKRGKSLLEAAADNGHLHVVRYLTEMGADVNARTWQGHGSRTILDLAVGRHDLEIVTFLCGLDNISLNPHNYIYSVLCTCLESVPFSQAIMAQLLRKAAPETLPDALAIAITLRDVTAVAYLAENIDASCFGDALVIASLTAHLPCLDVLLSSGKADPNARNSEKSLPLHTACAFGTLPIIRRLYAVTTTTDMLDAEGNTPLHLASKHGNVEAVEFLIKEGSDINAKNHHVEKPLHLAVQYNREDVQRLLLDNGAKWEPLASSGDVPHAFNFGVIPHDQNGDSSDFDITEAFRRGDQM